MASQLLKDMIQDSYHGAELEFCGEVGNAQFARLAIQLCADEKLGWHEYLQLHQEFLKDQKLNSKEIQSQLKKVENLINYFNKV